MTATVRIIPSADPFEVKASKPDSKAWKGNQIAGRLVPSATFSIFRNVPDSFVANLVACQTREEREALYSTLTPNGTDLKSAVNLTIDDIVGHLRAAGSRVNADRLASEGIYIVAETTDNLSAIDAMLRLAGLDPSEFDPKEEPTDEPKEEPNVEPTGKVAKA